MPSRWGYLCMTCGKQSYGYRHRWQMTVGRYAHRLGHRVAKAAGV